MISSAAFLRKTGYVLDQPADQMSDLRPVLITAVLSRAPAEKVRDYLETEGRVHSVRSIVSWLKDTRAWLGLPEIGRGRPSAKYLAALAKWHEINGFPTEADIDEGWMPAHHRTLSLSDPGTVEEPRKPAGKKSSSKGPTSPEEIRAQENSSKVIAVVTGGSEGYAKEDGSQGSEIHATKQEKIQLGSMDGQKRSRLSEISSEIETSCYKDETAWAERIINLQIEEYFLINGQEATEVDIADLRRGLGNLLLSLKRKAKKASTV